jgi:hypothetical protein
MLIAIYTTKARNPHVRGREFFIITIQSQKLASVTPSIEYHVLNTTVYKFLIMMIPNNIRAL